MQDEEVNSAGGEEDDDPWSEDDRFDFPDETP